jgi:endogenous inhibitor of DNA gyrase (YacG/DUF329 family)
MRCPVCHREFEQSTSTALPFCCERCRTIDLGRWLGETYALPAESESDADEQSDQSASHPGNGVANEPS